MSTDFEKESVFVYPFKVTDWKVMSNETGSKADSGEIENGCETRETYTTIGKAEKDEFEEITDKMHQTWREKRHDYGNSFHDTYNEFGLVSAVVRITDKVNRLKKLCSEKNEVEDESIDDTLRDLANYAVMTLIERKNEQES